MSADGKPAIDPLDVDNYATWSVRMRALLLSKGLWGAVTGDAMEAVTGVRVLPANCPAIAACLRKTNFLHKPYFVL